MLARAYKTRSVPSWLQVYSDWAEGVIREANGKGWPVTLQQIRRTAGSLGWRVHIEAELTLIPGFSANGVIVVGDSGSEAATFSRIIHEMAERLMMLDIRPRDAQEPRDATVPHQVALQVESVYLRYLQDHLDSLRRIELMKSAQRILFDLPETTRESEACDPDFYDD